jgi:hypothetical protein
MVTAASEKQRIFSHVCSYVLRLDESDAVWSKLNALAQRYGLNLESAAAQRAHAPKRQTESVTGKLTQVSAKEPDWDATFAQLDLSTPHGLETSYAMFREGEPPLEHERFWQEVVKRVQAGKEVDFLNAYSVATAFDLFNLREVVRAVPTEWKSRMATKGALRHAILSISTRHCFEITNSRRYQPFPLHLATEADLSVEDVIASVLQALGERGENFDSDRLFTLVELLAPSLSIPAAQDALNFALTLFEEDLQVTDGDGPWSTALEPPPEISDAIAGFLWAALAAPEASLRWQAAHSVRSACSLGQMRIIDELIRVAHKPYQTAFVDARFHFYDLHAQLYLLIALARIATEHPQRLQDHADFFKDVALQQTPHVLMTHFAKLICESLYANGCQKFTDKEILQLSSLNHSPFKAVGSKVETKQSSRARPMNQEAERRFHFGLDMESYWFNHLADCFGKSTRDIEDAAEKVICDDWELNENGYWDRDARATLYNDRETYNSHGSYPKTDDLSFYLSYHAMMVVAGQLLRTEKMHVDEDDDGDKFQRWLSSHLLCRSDGRWLADRRDPSLIERRRWKDVNQGKDWRWLIDHSDFDNVLGLGTGRLNVWGSWKVMSGSHEEEITINSALASNDRSAALLRALQTAEGCRDYRIPGFGDDVEIDHEQFQLKGWVENRHQSNNLDEFDPWSGDINYPPLSPAKFVQQSFDLVADGENRVWTCDLNGQSKDVLWSSVWGVWKGDEFIPEHGRRLQADPSFLEKLLSKIGMDLIIKVTIERRNGYRRYESRSKEEEIEYVEPYCKLFLLRPDGELRTLRECARTGSEAC